MPKAKLYPYQGKEYTLKQLAKLPECEFTPENLRQRILRGMNIDAALKAITPEERIQRDKEEKRRQKALKIMSVPVNPEKCRYTKVHQEINKNKGV